MSEMVKISFDIPIEEYDEKIRPYIRKYKDRHGKAYDAFIEWATRKAGRDQKRKKEQLVSDMELLRPVVQALIDSNRITFDT
jgi:hypothetical protein